MTRRTKRSPALSVASALDVTTALRAEVWAAGTAEPTAWDPSATDSAAALQVPGPVGVMGFLSASPPTPR